MAKIKKKSADMMDMVEQFGDGVASRIPHKGSWVVKAIIMSISIIVLSGVIVFVTLFKKTAGKK